MAWTKEWTIDSVEGNYKAIGCIDYEDVEQLIADSRELEKFKYLLEKLESRSLEVFNALDGGLMSDEQEHRIRRLGQILTEVENSK